MASMLRTLRHGFLKDALDFAGVHRERLAEVNKNVFRFYVHVVVYNITFESHIKVMRIKEMISN